MDLETYGKDFIIPYCFCLIYRNKKLVFYGEKTCITSGFKWIFDTCVSNTVFYAHNLNFDGNVILNFLPSNINLDDSFTILKRGDFYSLCLTDGQKKIILKCSAKILPLSLEEIGYTFNVGNKIVVDHSKADKDSINDMSFKTSIKAYCENDATMVTRFLTKVSLSLNGLERLNNVYSISGLSLNIFKKNYNTYNIFLRTDKVFDTLIRPSYYGGRCEVFGNLKNDEKCFHFDFSGMYTNRLMEEYPYGDYIINNSPKKINKKGFFYVSVYSNLDLPVLPYRDEKTGKLLFPNGRFSGLYWCEELILFEEAGGVIEEIKYSIEFEKFGYVFKDFGVYCDISRKKSIYEKILWKLIPNSFIGRLGLKYDEEETLIIEDSKYDPHFYDVICDKKINNNWIVRVKKENNEIKHGNVMYPAIVTSKARVLWWKSSKKVIEKGGRILYCDTDSIFAAFKKTYNPLGEHHGDVYWDPNKKDTALDDACFVTSKVYCICYDNSDNVKIKGVSKRYLNQMDMVSFKKIFHSGGSETFKTLNFEKKKLNIKITELNKLIDFSFYDKRLFNEDKTETKSLFI